MSIDALSLRTQEIEEDTDDSSSAAYNSTGTQIVMALEDGTPKLWDGKL